MTYEGARSITGPYLAILGTSAFTVGFVAGFGELAGYVLRLFSERFIDRTHNYWAVNLYFPLNGNFYTYEIKYHQYEREIFAMFGKE